MNASIKYTMLIIILIITFLPCQSLSAKEHEENVLNSTLPTDDDVFLNNLLIFSAFDLYLADMTFDDILSYQKIEGSEIEFKEQFGRMVLDMSTQTKYDIMSYNPETHIYRFDDLAIYFNEHRRDSVICLYEHSVDNVLNRLGGDDYDHIWIIPKQSTLKCWMYSFDGTPRYVGSFTTEYDKYGRVINYRGQKIQYNAFNRISTLMKYNNTSIIWTDDRTISSIEDLGGFYENRNFEITKRNEKGLWTEMIEYGFDLDGNRINLVLRTRTFKEITKQETSQTIESE